MEKIKSRISFLKAILSVSACCAIAIPATIIPVEAYSLPPSIMNEVQTNYSAGTIQNEVGGNYKHDTDTFKNQRNEREIREDYTNYQNMRDRNQSDSGQSDLIRDYSRDDSSQYSQGSDRIQAQVEQSGVTSGVYINTIDVSPSEVLTKEEIDKATSSILGRNVMIDEIQKVIDEINNMYASKGFVTAKAFLPEQTISNGMLHIELVESRIGNITVQQNKWTKSKYITDRLPQKETQLFDIVELEKDILDFNRYNEGVKLSANLKAGEQPGTTDIELAAEEKFPFHLTGIMDNAGRQSIGKLRGGAMIYADSLFGNRDRMSLGTYFSKSSVSPFFDYNIPVNKRDGRVGFMYSSSFAKLTKGDLAFLDLKSKSYTYSLYYSQPLIRKPGMELKAYTALNYKRARTSMFDDIIQLGTDQITSVEAALNLRKDTKYGIWYLNQSAYYAAPIIDKNSNYVKLSGSAVRLHDFSHGVIGMVRSNYQVIPNNKHIPYLDQFQTGGLVSVRGYNEGILMGKNGYFMSGELMFPIMPREITKPGGNKMAFIGKYVKGAVFADHAGVFPTSSEDAYGGSYFLASLGLGLRAQLPGELSARLYWGYPLVNNAYEYDRKYGRFHFELTMAPDFDALLSHRSTAPKLQPQKQVEAEEYINNYDDVRHYDYYQDGRNGTL